MTISGTPPSARFGHAAFADVNTITDVKRMIVFGGTSAVGQAPSDLKVYELRIDSGNPANGTWSELTPSDLGATLREIRVSPALPARRESADHSAPSRSSQTTQRPMIIGAPCGGVACGPRPPKLHVNTACT